MRANFSHLQDVVVFKSGCDSDLLRNNQRIHEVFIRDVVELLAVPCPKLNVYVVSHVMTRTIDTGDVHLGITRE